MYIQFVTIFWHTFAYFFRHFIGTFVSTFSFRIHEEREIMGFEPETTFNRLCAKKEKDCEQPSKWKIVYWCSTDIWSATFNLQLNSRVICCHTNACLLWKLSWMQITSRYCHSHHCCEHPLEQTCWSKWKWVCLFIQERSELFVIEFLAMDLCITSDLYVSILSFIILTFCT